jgi:hypothetical protein
MLTNLLHSTVLNSTELTPLIVLLATPRHKPYRKQRSPVAVFIVACAAIGADRTENAGFQPVHWRMLEMYCLATGVVYRNLSNEATCYIMYIYNLILVHVSTLSQLSSSRSSKFRIHGI